LIEIEKYFRKLKLVGLDQWMRKKSFSHFDFNLDLKVYLDCNVFLKKGVAYSI